ncbi:phage portal protein [uncultured Roseovarius sp.]|uniref:phage portal protein n=1 Tax=uncultured Roseovarius sp. TaxID=293344 RepID=UPI00259A4B17|nr:phage portal protein [uncultured Roseovarius sp.]
MALANPFAPIARLFRRDAPTAQRRSFDAATGGRRGQAFRAFGPTSTETLAAAGPVRSRARHAFANNGYIANGVAAIVAEAVGAGIEPASAHPDTDLRPILNGAFLGFAAEADTEGRTDLRGLVSQMVQATVVDGESFALIEDDPEGLRVRLIPAEMVDESTTRNLGGGGYIAAGIEFDARGRRVAYHVQPHRPTELFPTAGEPVRVPAENMLHLMRPLGPGQVRGVSWLASVLLTVNEFDQLQDALLVGAKIAAMHAGFVTDQNNLGGTGPYSDANDLTDISLEPGVVRVLPSGTDIKFNTPNEAKESIAFAKLTLGQIAAGLGVPQHLLDGDLSDANYSSLRAGLLPFRQKIEQFVYHQIAPQILDPLWRRVISREYIAERLDLDALEPAFKVEWLAPRAMQVDPMKDTQALIAQIGAGLTSRTQAVASLGWNAADMDAEIAADRERESALNLQFGGSNDAS